MLSHESLSERATLREARTGLARVLVAIDLTVSSPPVLRRAGRLPLAADAQVVVLHALEPAKGDRSSLGERGLRHAIRQLSRAGGSAGLSVSGRLEQGDWKEHLARLAQELQPELIVMGHPRQPSSGIRRLWERAEGNLLDRVPGDLLIISSEVARAYRRPLVSLDANEEVQPLMDAALRLCPEPSALVAVHELDTSYELVLHQTGAAASRLLEWREAAMKRARRELEERLHDYRERQLPLEVRIRSGEPFEAILEEGHRHRADLVVMGKHARPSLARLLHPHEAERVLASCSCDVLIVDLAR